MNSKKILGIAAVVVAAVWIFCISFLVSSNNMRKQKANEQTQSSATLPVYSSTTAPATATTSGSTLPKFTMDGNQMSTNVTVETPAWVIEESRSKQASEAASIAEQLKNSSKQAAKETKQTEKSSVPSGKGEIVRAYVDAVNRLKETPSFSLTKTDKLSVEIDKISGGSSVQSIASSMIDNNTKSEPEIYNFSDGVDPSSGKSPDAVIAPISQRAQLSESNVTSASAVQSSAGGYKLSITLGQSTQTLSTPAAGYSTAMEVIDIDSLGLPSSANINELNITYDNSTIEAEIDSSGRITSMTHTLVVSKADGSGKMLLVPITVELHGNCVSNYRISY